MVHSDGIAFGSIDDSNIFDNSLSFVRFNGTSIATFYYNVSGIYLLPQPMFSEGNIVDIRVFGYLREEDLILLVDANRAAAQNGQTISFTCEIRPFLYILVYRPDAVSGALTLIHGPALISHNLSPGCLMPDWPVMKGDFIGVLIPEMCMESMESEITLCPSQINLRTPGSRCLSALYYNPSSDEVEQIMELGLDQFEEVQVELFY